jgi:hypothetical protein
MQFGELLADDSLLVREGPSPRFSLNNSGKIPVHEIASKADEFRQWRC